MVTLIMPKKGYFADRLRDLRNKAGLTQAQLGEQAGLAADTVRQFESGRREPAFETLVKLAAGLGVSLSAFDPEEDEPKKRKGK